MIVYCASPDCPASDDVAAALVSRGFRRVYDYAGGLSDWQQGGYPIASSPSIEEDDPANALVSGRRGPPRGGHATAHRRSL
ncbi:MAG: rhodanese-like domain-containing protein [bacterium]